MMASSVTSPMNCGHVEDEFVVSARNWTRGSAALGRGEGVEPRGSGGMGPNGHRSTTGDHGRGGAWWRCKVRPRFRAEGEGGEDGEHDELTLGH